MLTYFASYTKTRFMVCKSYFLLKSFIVLSLRLQKYGFEAFCSQDLSHEPIPCLDRSELTRRSFSALRSDWSSEKDKKAMDDAAQQGIEWFSEYLT